MSEAPSAGGFHRGAYVPPATRFPEKLMARCPEGWKERLDRIARRKGKRQSEVVREALLEYITRHEDE